MINVKKRDGKIVEFDIQKIKDIPLFNDTYVAVGKEYQRINYIKDFNVDSKFSTV